MIDGTWATVEMLGHRSVVGQLSEVTVAGAPMLRIEVPTEPPGVVIAAPASLYCITPITEDAARARHAKRPELPYPVEVSPFDEYVDDDDFDDSDLYTGD